MLFDYADFRTHSVDSKAALWSILGFWAFFFAIVTFRSFVMAFPDQFEMALRRLVVCGVGITLNYGLYLFLRQFDRRRLGMRIVTAFLAAIPFAVAIAMFNYLVFSVVDPVSLSDDPTMYAKHEGVDMLVKELTEAATSRYFFLIAWAALYLALGYAAEVKAAERRMSAAISAAQVAELRALRYQVNPHFLFNTLNSLSSLVLTDRRDEAEKMIMNLSTFFRTSLTGDPTEDVMLAEELRLQRLYLDIEAVRFPDRLAVAIDVPAELLTACVPGLILQPLVENAIKYGVSRARRPVTVTIEAREQGSLLVLTVADDGDPMPQNAGAGGGDAGSGTGVGLNNVRSRLEARFGAQATAYWGVLPGGGFRVTLAMPMKRHDC